MFRTADIKKTFSKEKSTNFSFLVYTNSFTVHYVAIESNIQLKDTMTPYGDQQD